MKKIPEFIKAEGDVWPDKAIDDDGFIKCDCGFHGVPERWSYGIFWEEEIEEAALACPECQKAVCYMTVLLAGSPAYNAVLKMQGRFHEVIEHELVRERMRTCS